MPIHLIPRGPESAPALPTRRAFLGRMMLGSAALALGSTAVRTRAEDAAPPWHAWLSDIHIAADPEFRAREQNMAANLRATVAEILAETDRPRSVFIDGDLAYGTGQAGDYQTVLDLLKPLREAKLPIHLAMGNHDNRENFRAVLHAEPPPDTAIHDRHVSTVSAGKDLRIIVLDSLIKTNTTPGLLGEAQLAWLAKSLDAEPTRATILFVHHYLSTRPGALNDTPAFLELIEPRKQVKAVVYGHSHRWEYKESNGLHLINLPAIAYPFAADQPLAWARFQPTANGGDLTLRCIGGDRSKHGETIKMTWR